MDLYEALSITPGVVVSAVGGGGKTSLVHALAGEAAGRGLSAIITTTTKSTPPPGLKLPPAVTADDEEMVRALEGRIVPGEVVLATSGRGSRNRVLGLLPETVDAIARRHDPGLIAVEADGAAHRPFKAPGEHEPVIPFSSTHVVVCVGLEVLGEALDEQHVHRPEIVAALASCATGQRVTADVIVAVLTHELGGRKGVPAGAHLSALLNNPATGEHERLGAHIAGRLVYAGFHRAVVASAHRPGDIRAVVR